MVIRTLWLSPSNSPDLSLSEALTSQATVHIHKIENKWSFCLFEAQEESQQTVGISGTKGHTGLKIAPTLKAVLS